MKAVDKEINSLNKNETWVLVEKPKDNKIIEVKWLFNRKNENLYEARLVAKGFQQTESVGNLYSPVAKMLTLELLLSFCCKNNFCIEQMDVKTASLNGKISSEIYVNQPNDYEDGTNKVGKLLKALY